MPQPMKWPILNQDQDSRDVIVKRCSITDDDIFAEEKWMANFMSIASRRELLRVFDVLDFNSVEKSINIYFRFINVIWGIEEFYINQIENHGSDLDLGEN